MKKNYPDNQVFTTERCTPMGYNVFNAIAKGIVVAIDRTMLVKHAEHLTFTFSWSRNVLSKIAQSEKKMVQ